MRDTALLRAEGLTPAPARGPVQSPHTLHGLALQLNQGERVAVVGPPGAGKTVLLRALALIHKPAAGQILFEGADLTRLPDHKLRALRQRFQYVGGQPTRSLPPRQTVGTALREPLDIHRLGATAERTTRVEASAQEWGINRWLLNRPVSALSAALRQRVSVARALMLDPRVLISDEVIDHLEPAAAGPLLQDISEHCRARGMAWLWSARETGFARDYADRVLRLEGGQLLPA